MVRKPRKVVKAVAKERKQAPPKVKYVEQEKTAEQLIYQNGKMVEELLLSNVWLNIIEPLLDETISSVSGRKTSGYYHHGSFTKLQDDTRFLQGYQKAGMDIYNRIKDFVRAKENLMRKKEEANNEAVRPMFNPFLEELKEDGELID